MDHNKKRNTAFLYEALTKEVAKSSMEDNESRKKKTVQLLKEFFSEGSILREDLQLYRSMYDADRTLYPHQAEKLIHESKMEAKEELDEEELFKEQSRLLNRIDKDLDHSVYSNFIPNYKHLATIYQVLGRGELDKRQKVLLEDNLVEMMCVENEDEEESERKEPIDKLSYLKFVEKFNKKYSDQLIQEQKELLSKYLHSIGENEADFKIYLDNELGRLKESLNRALDRSAELREDTVMKDQTEEVLEQLEEISQKSALEKKELKKIMKVQELVQELENDN